jgi:hypothetical protein
MYQKHYIRIDDRHCIVDGFSDAFRQPQAGDICINKHGGRHFRLFDHGIDNPLLFDMEHFVLLYKWDGTTVVPRTQAEIDADIAALTAPPLDPITVLTAENTLLKAQVRALTDRGEFVEDCIAEMAMQVYA